jgi:spore maturation protein CgeB
MNVLCVLSRYAYGKPERGENYDYVHFVAAFERMGHNVDFFDSGDRSLYGDFADLNMALLERVASRRPDVIFCVLMHYEIWFETLDLIRNQSPALVVNWGTDDSWKFTQASRIFAEHVDLHVTTDLLTAEVAPSKGLNNVFLSQWAASAATLAEPCSSQSCRYDVSFVGSIYGYRAEWIAALRASGIAVSCFGYGTENGVVSVAEIPKIYQTSRISLNFSGSGRNSRGTEKRDQRQIKARTFEVPGAGGFLLTEAAPGLARYFKVGSEIATFASPAELVEKVRYYLGRPDERDAIAHAGHLRVTTEHTYEQRFSEILEKLRALQRQRGVQPWSISSEALEPSVKQHRSKFLAGWLRSLLINLFSLAFGRERGARAARRSAYELSWRFCGATTYGARGLPGRIFYAES